MFICLSFLTTYIEGARMCVCACVYARARVFMCLQIKSIRFHEIIRVMTTFYFVSFHIG